MSKIVVVDDSYAELQVIEGVLKGANHTVVSFPNTEKLEDKVIGEKPDLIVMDINMPRLDGIKATMLIKRVYPHVVVVGLSVYANDDTRQAMTAAGATTVISKEAAVEQLRDEIIESINRRSAAIH